MNKKRKTSANGVKKKLMGAVCMLLVASIMMISATYAWFTLSTAPEVTGITTSVGANGSLEMALLSKASWESPDTTISSKVGDSSAATKDVTQSNITWGNLVDLSDASYGTNAFTLNPAALNIAADGQVDMSTPLATPVYGSDGRVSKLDKNTVTGIYSTTDKAFVTATDQEYGVRAIGVAAAMTQEQLALRVAMANVAVRTASAKSTVQNALNANGGTLASMAAAVASDDTYEATDKDLAAVNAVLDAVKSAKNDLKLAIQNAMKAEDLSKDNAVSDAMNKEASAYDLTSATGYNQSIQDAITAYNAIATDAVDKATDKATAKTVLSALMDVNNLQLNGKNVKNLSKDDAGDLLSSAMSMGLNLTMTDSNTGAIRKVAEMTGNINATIYLNMVIQGISFNNVKATMATNVTGTAKMASVSTFVSGLTAATANSTNTTTPITDMYGYAVDLAFRTNASGSYLKLQTAEAQRIYSDSDDASTQGKGSYMELTPSADLTAAQFAGLVDAIHVLFVDGTGKVVAVAGLDSSKIATDQNNAAKPLKSKLPLNIETTTLKGVDADGRDATINFTKTEGTDNKITDLTQGNATKLTVMVYLDGNTVQNSNVSATAMNSLSGTMNLQFASSADLVPMDYTPLHNRKTTGEETQPQP